MIDAENDQKDSAISDNRRKVSKKVRRIRMYARYEPRAPDTEGETVPEVPNASLFPAPKLLAAYGTAEVVLDRVRAPVRGFARGGAIGRMATILALSYCLWRWKTRLVIALGAPAHADLPKPIHDAADEVAEAILARPSEFGRIRFRESEGDAFYGNVKRDAHPLIAQLGRTKRTLIERAANQLLGTLDESLYQEMNCKHIDQDSSDAITGLFAATKVASAEASATECVAMWIVMTHALEQEGVFVGIQVPTVGDGSAQPQGSPGSSSAIPGEGKVE